MEALVNVPRNVERTLRQDFVASGITYVHVVFVPVFARSGYLATNAFATTAQSLILDVDTWPIRTVAKVLTIYLRS